MSNQLTEGVSDGLGGCDFYFYSIRGDCRFCQPTHPEGGERWRERGDKSGQEEAVASS